MVTTQRTKATKSSRTRVFLILNPFMRLMLHLPIKGNRNGCCCFRSLDGRAVKHFTVPLSYVEDRDGSLLIPGGGTWKLNLASGRTVTVRLRGKEVHADPDVIWDTGEIERLLPRLFNGNRRAEGLVGMPLTADGKPDREKLAHAIEGGFAMVRLGLMS